MSFVARLRQLHRHPTPHAVSRVELSFTSSKSQDPRMPTLLSYTRTLTSGPGPSPGEASTAS